jgi:predicted dehydrogenase
LNCGVIGCGRWGPNHIRVLTELDRSNVIACADPNAARREAMARRFPQTRVLADYRELLADEWIDAVVIATPTDTHFDITRHALEAGKHVLVEKPITSTSRQADELIDLADRQGLVLMVGHVFLFNNGINRLRDLVASGEMGRVHYLDATRTNLGPIRGDVNALYDLATHDISILNYLLDATPVDVSAVGRCISQERIEDVCFATLRYPDDTLGHIHVSWMNPKKVRTLTVVGEGKMAHWDDLNPSEPVRVYDKGVDEYPHYDSYGEFKYVLRSGDVHLPSVPAGEPLTSQARAFVEWVLDGKSNPSGGRYGRDVVRTLEAATASMAAGGTMTPVGEAVETRVV